jgi:hypothetical protein
MIGMRTRRTVLAVWRYEWESLISLKIGLVLAALALMSAATTVVTANGLAPAVRALRRGSPFAESIAYAPLGFLAVLFYVYGAMSIGNDARYRRSLLLHVAVPQRALSYVAKLTFVVMIGSIAGLAALALGVLGTWANGDMVVFRSSTGWSSLFVSTGLRAFVAITFYLVASFSATALTNSFLWGLMIPAMASTVVEPVILISTSSRASWLAGVLPFSAVRETLGLGSGVSVPGLHGQEYAIVLVWLVALIGAGGYRYVRRDW